MAAPGIAALWRLNVSPREKTFWKMLYESAARADEVLCLNVEDLYPQDKRGRITAEGGAIEWIHWQSGTAQLLPRLIACRTRGPLFLTDRKAPAGTPTLDTSPMEGQHLLILYLGEACSSLVSGDWEPCVSTIFDGVSREGTRSARSDSREETSSSTAMRIDTVVMAGVDPYASAAV